MKAFRSFESVHGNDPRPWFLTIVRNTSFTLLGRRKDSLVSLENFDAAAQLPADIREYDPQALAMRAADVQAVRSAIAALVPQFREVIVLREMQSLSYKEIGKIIGIPIGTVMSRLARARVALQELLMKSEVLP